MARTEITIDDEIRELKRELGLRRSVYPKWSSGPGAKLKKADADRYIAVMETTLKRMERIKAELTPQQQTLFKS